MIIESRYENVKAVFLDSCTLKRLEFYNLIIEIVRCTPQNDLHVSPLYITHNGLEFFLEKK